MGFEPAPRCFPCFSIGRLCGFFPLSSPGSRLNTTFSSSSFSLSSPPVFRADTSPPCSTSTQCLSPHLSSVAPSQQDSYTLLRFGRLIFTYSFYSGLPISLLDVPGQIQCRLCKRARFLPFTTERVEVSPFPAQIIFPPLALSSLCLSFLLFPLGTGLEDPISSERQWPFPHWVSSLTSS